MKHLMRISLATAAICMALGSAPSWAQSAPTPIVAKPLDLQALQAALAHAVACGERRRSPVEP